MSSAKSARSRGKVETKKAGESRKRASTSSAGAATLRRPARGVKVEQARAKPRAGAGATKAAGKAPRKQPGAVSRGTKARAGTAGKPIGTRKVAPSAGARAGKLSGRYGSVRKISPKGSRAAARSVPRAPKGTEGTAQRAKAAKAQKDKRNKAARDRRAEQRGLEDRKRAQRIERDRKRRAKKAGKVDERDLAIKWLERIREDFASVVPTSLSITEAEVGAGTPWLVVGRFDFLEDLDYETLAQALQVIADDLPLEAAIHPQRLSQIRIVYADPNAKRGEGDSIVSKIGSWESILGDLIGEIIGAGPSEEGEIDEGALAARYAETMIPMLYIYFSAEITGYRTVAPWQRTQTIQLKK